MSEGVTWYEEWISLTKVTRLFEEEKIDAVNQITKKYEEEKIEATKKYEKEKIETARKYEKEKIEAVNKLAKEMLLDNIDIINIMKYTKLPKNEIIDIQNELGLILD